MNYGFMGSGGIQKAAGKNTHSLKKITFRLLFGVKKGEEST